MEAIFYNLGVLYNCKDYIQHNHRGQPDYIYRLQTRNSTTHLLGFHENFEVGFAQSPVPVISDMTTIHDLSKQVA